jgi:hypothetical protein
VIQPDFFGVFSFIPAGFHTLKKCRCRPNWIGRPPMSCCMRWCFLLLEGALSLLSKFKTLLESITTILNPTDLLNASV